MQVSELLAELQIATNTLADAYFDGSFSLPSSLLGLLLVLLGLLQLLPQLLLPGKGLQNKPAVQPLELESLMT